MRFLEPRSCGLPCALLRGPGHDPNIVGYHFTSLQGTGEMDFSLVAGRKGIPLLVGIKCGVEKLVGIGHGLSV